MQVNVDELMQSSGVQFGTSGVRGKVEDMTGWVCFAYVKAFLKYLENAQQISQGSVIGIAGDLRSSTPLIMEAVAAACLDVGMSPVYFGKIPSPAIALFGLYKKMPTIMVTGSHIPDDRNGIKFNTATGEILKHDEQGIRAQQIDIPEDIFNLDGTLLKLKYLPTENEEARKHYIQRFVGFFPENCLQGKRVGLYEHSSVSRDCFKTIFKQLGAEVTSLGRSEHFISVDTEAIRPEDVKLAANWAAEQEFDCIISTDGDGDRPLVSDEKGIWLRGDVVGILCAHFLGADVVVTPVSSNTAVEKSNLFARVIRTRIGSPYVIDAMQTVIAKKTGIVVGYEANGGFLQHTSIVLNGKTLSPLPTRDAALVPIVLLLLAGQKNKTLSELCQTLPVRITYSDRIKEFATQSSQQIIANMTEGTNEKNLIAFGKYFPFVEKALSMDTTDGVRVTLENDEIIHIRPSGNAPELRCYVESGSPLRAKDLNHLCLTQLKQLNKL